MREFLQVLRRFLPPYKKYLTLSVVFNILSAVLNIFSFAALIPILQILFQTDQATAATRLMDWSEGSVREVLSNNADYYIGQMVGSWGATTTLLIIGLFLAFMTFLKTGAYFLSSATIIPIRTGVVRDIRNQLYQKINSLHLGFFSEERKGDIIARMSGDVQEIESSIMSSLDMLFKNPILIVVYFAVLLITSWQLTLFTIIFVPIFGWFMGLVGRKLKQKSIKAQALWSDTMSQVEETLGGLRIIKAFCAEQLMNERFNRINSAYRNDIMRVNIRQSMAHPMSEFLGTVMIVIVLWFGGILVLNDKSITGPTFIFYMTILYSIINPLKEFSKAGYNIPKGLASMERVDKILKAEVDIREAAQPVFIDNFQHQIEFPRLFPLWRAVGAPRHQPCHSQGQDRRPRRPVGFRQVHPRRPHSTLLRRSGGRGAHRRHQRPPARAPLSPPAHRQCQSGGHSLQRFLPQQHRLWLHTRRPEVNLLGRSSGPSHPGSRPHSQRLRLHHAVRTWFRHQHRRPWRTPLGRPAAARQHCPRHPEESPHPHP